MKKSYLKEACGSLSFILLGDSAVGKSCFFNRYFKNQYPTSNWGFGIDKEIKFIKIDNKIYKLTVWDTSGQERFRASPRKYYQHVDGVLLFFDVTSEETFGSVSNWIKYVKDNSNKNITNDSNNQLEISLYLIGNKIEQPERIITKEKAEELANSLGMKYFEISSNLI